MGPHHDSYGAFAGHYDKYQWDWFAPTYGAQLQRLLEERGFTGGRILDAGCGTGTLALQLASRGFKVTGLDLSEPMIEAARRKDREGAVLWRQGDITRFDLEGSGAPFDAIVTVADILNHLETLDEWGEAFRCFASHLRPGGALFLDAMTTLGLRKLDKIVVDEVDERLMILAIIYEPQERRSTVKLTSFVRAASGPLYERVTRTITEWGHPVAGILERLSRAGFSGVTRPWSKAPDAEAETRLQVIAFRT